MDLRNGLCEKLFFLPLPFYFSSYVTSFSKIINMKSVQALDLEYPFIVNSRFNELGEITNSFRYIRKFIKFKNRILHVIRSKFVKTKKFVFNKYLKINMIF